ncbi:MAG: hypothetical protein KJ990_02240 [Proteobacteria bacterium]|nr:hypothetical protein [Pseudomonadota bacterium]MBU1649310.1 hypothetical protein [Pseudomonadota bacterium]MBU1986346.1 hypothetical protein [Pseudomonadota bacterium]
MENYHIEMRSYRIIGWGWIVFCAVGMIVTFLSKLYWPAAGCVFSSLFGAYMVLGSGSFDIDHDGLIHKSSFGTWQIRWDEISRVEIGEVEGTMVLHGNNKRFILSSPGGWDGSVKDDAFAFVIKQLEARDIPLQPSGTAAYKIMKNTRVLTNQSNG